MPLLHARCFQEDPTYLHLLGRSLRYEAFDPVFCQACDWHDRPFMNIRDLYPQLRIHVKFLLLFELNFEGFVSGLSFPTDCLRRPLECCKI